MKKIIAIIFLMFSQSGWSHEKLDALLDGLHKDAHEGNFQNYFPDCRNNNTTQYHSGNTLQNIKGCFMFLKGYLSAAYFK